jgi:hypothetical protein
MMRTFAKSLTVLGLFTLLGFSIWYLKSMWPLLGILLAPGLASINDQVDD